MPKTMCVHREIDRLVTSFMTILSSLSKIPIHDFCAAPGGQSGDSTPNCLAYSAFSLCQPPNFIASGPTMRPIGVPPSSRSSTSKQMCHPAAPIAMKRRPMLVHSVRRVPLPAASSFHRISNPPHVYSNTAGASARVTVVSVTRAAGAPTVVSFTVAPAVPRFPSASNGAHSRRCAGSVSACHTFSGAWRSSLSRISVHFSPSLRTCAPYAALGVYISRSVIFFSCSPSRAGLLQSGRALLPALQLSDLNEVAAGILQHGDGRAVRIGGRHREFRPAPLNPFVLAFDVVGEEIGGRLALSEDRFLIRLGRGVVVQRQL